VKTAMLSLVAVCTAAIIASPASAQSAIDHTVKMQLDSTVVLMDRGGFELQGPFRSGVLRTGEETVIPLELQEGRAFIIVGFCDIDCDDIDLVLADATGTQLDSDFKPDDVPMVAVEISRTGTYHLTVSMPSCRIDPCGYGVAVFASR
jgi:hypothetical protein